jgi:hypothetical protein
MEEHLESIADALGDIADNTNNNNDSSTGEKTSDILNNICYNLKRIADAIEKKK